MSGLELYPAARGDDMQQGRVRMHSVHAPAALLVVSGYIAEAGGAGVGAVILNASEMRTLAAALAAEAERLETLARADWVSRLEASLNRVAARIS